MKHNLYFCFFILTFSLSVQAKSSVQLNAVNYPVWVVRNLQVISLAPGTELLQDDIVTTGNSGRAWISMQDGSVVKLGQNTKFEITAADFHQVQDASLLDATFNVIKGAFRFTSGFFNTNFTSSHKVKITIGATTIGIRGTDIWGRSTETEDFITLLEGSITVDTDVDAIAILSEPLTAYRKLKDQPADPVYRLEVSQVQKLGAETELSFERGIANIEGKFDLILMSLKNSNNAQKEIERFKLAGYAVKAESQLINETVFTRVVLAGFKDNQSANNMSQQLLEEFKLQNIWIRKN